MELGELPLKLGGENLPRLLGRRKPQTQARHEQGESQEKLMLCFWEYRNGSFIMEKSGIRFFYVFLGRGTEDFTGGLRFHAA